MFQRTMQYSDGTLVMNGGVKTYYTSGTTDSAGKITKQLTDNGLSTGVALFNEIWSVNAQATVNATSPADAVSSYRESLSANLKTLVQGFYRANAVTVTLGLVYSPFTSVGSGTPVQFRVDGV